MKNHRWDKVRKLEDNYKAKFLRLMSREKSFKIFLGLYQLGQEVTDKKYYSTLDPVKIKSLVQIRSLANKLKQ